MLSSLRDSRDAGLIARWRWFEVMAPEVRRLLAPPVRILVAHNPDLAADTRADIFGWLALDDRRAAPAPPARGPHRVIEMAPPLVVWCYVKSHWRGRGYARGLFAAAGLDPFADRFDYLARSETLFVGDGGRQPLIKRMSRARWTPQAGRRERDGDAKDEARDRGGDGAGAGADHAARAGTRVA